MRPYSEALQQLLSDVGRLSQSEVESVELMNATGRVLANDVVSPMNVPPKDNSAMDGYALKLNEADGTDAERTWVVTATRLAGDATEINVLAGQAVRIMTGAEVPEGADTVIMQEEVTRDGDVIRIKGEHREGENIRVAGNDIAEGRTIIAAGTRLDASHMGLLASVGVDKLSVYRQPTVALLSTGDELTEPGQPLPAGAIYNSNRYFLLPMLEKLGCKVLDLGTIRDDKAAIRQAFAQAAQDADFVVTTGGVSVGDADFVKEVLDELGNIDFWKVAIKPGKPFACGSLTKDPTKKAGYLFGLPGNPVSAIVTFMLLARPALEQFSGQAVQPLAMLPAKLSQSVRKRPGRMDFQRANYKVSEAGELVVTPFNSQSSGVLSSIAESNCFIVLARDQGSVDEGAQVEILPFRQWL
ncbi:molybdopterin molybdotransferase MoeA [Litoribacillus peritrichatus]|uniref:Molybdopterin molybdenumtransferase n=1 Tax=Litoribacillus peritrichatus TaxID=718191 RepID=A0ABP7MZN2_9GAMM